MNASLRFLLAGAVVFSAACGSDSTGPDDDAALLGVYNLQTINDQVLPVVVAELGEDFLEITGGVVTLSEDGTFSDVTQLRITIDGEATDETDAGSGTWARDGNTVIFTVTGNSASYSMTWNGSDRLTQVIEGPLTLLYAK